MHFICSGTKDESILFIFFDYSLQLFHLFNKYLLNDYYVLSTVSGSEDPFKTLTPVYYSLTLAEMLSELVHS